MPLTQLSGKTLLISQILLAAFLPAALRGQNIIDGNTTPTATVLNGVQYIGAGNTTNPGITMSVLTGNFAQIGAAYGALNYPQVGTFSDALEAANITSNNVIVNIVGKAGYAAFMEPKYLPNSLAVLSSFQNGVPGNLSANYTTADMVLLDQSISLSYSAPGVGCSIFIVNGNYTTSGQTVVGRHLDWAMTFGALFAGNTSLTVLKPTGLNPVAQLNFAGQAAATSSVGWVNGSRVTISQLNGLLSTGSQSLNLLPGVTEPYSGIANILMRAQITSDVSEALMNFSNTIGGKWIASIEGQSGVSYEMSAYGGNKPFTGQDTGLLVSTNTFQNPDWTDQVLQGQPQYTGYLPGQLDSPSHTFLRLADLLNLVQGNTGLINLSVAQQIISTPMATDGNGTYLLPPNGGGSLLVAPNITANNNIDFTYFSFVMDHSQGTLLFQADGANPGPWNSIDMDYFINPSGPAAPVAPLFLTANTSSATVWNSSDTNWGTSPGGSGNIYNAAAVATLNGTVSASPNLVTVAGTIPFSNLQATANFSVQPADGSSKLTATGLFSRISAANGTILDVSTPLAAEIGQAVVINSLLPGQGTVFAGTVRLLAANNIQSLRVDTGTLQISAGNQLGNISLADGILVALGNQENDPAVPVTLWFAANLTTDEKITFKLNAEQSTFFVPTNVTATLQSSIFGGGGLYKDGPGTLVLSGDALGLSLQKGNYYTGATIVHGGTLVLDKPFLPGTFAVSGEDGIIVQNGGTLLLQKDDQIDGSWTPVGVLTGGLFQLNGHSANINGLIIGGGTVDATNGANLTTSYLVGSNGTIALQNSQLTLASNLSIAALDTTYTGTLSGSGNILFSQNGTLRLTGNNDLTGNFTVAAGGVQVDGTLGAAAGGLQMNITANGTLSGASLINANVTVGGLLNIGDGMNPGTMEISGLVAFANTSVTTFYLSSNTLYSQLILSAGNTTHLLDGTLLIDPLNALTLGNYTLFDMNPSSTLSGNFSSLIIPGYAASFSPSTGNLTITGTVPEPGHAALLAAGLSALVIVIARRRKPILRVTASASVRKKK